MLSNEADFQLYITSKMSSRSPFRKLATIKSLPWTDEEYSEIDNSPYEFNAYKIEGSNME